MNYSEAKTFIEYANTFGIRPGLDIVKELLSRLDNPQDELNVIHIAGTNGKGSICAYLEYGLRECELKIARYISPTLFTYLERFQINGKYISEEKFSEITYRVKCVCDEMVLDGLYHPTSFEIETAIAFLWFLDEEVDIVLLETGMGGREDATNVVKKPLATVFATISYDHTKFLGETIEEIALNKAGIMREGVPVIASHMPMLERNSVISCARDTLIKEADKMGSPIYFADDGRDVLIDNPLKGEFQKINVSCALLTYNVIEKRLKELYSSKNISGQQFVKGISNTKWPGRYETINEKPLIIRDGAHNADAATLLRQTIENDERIKEKIHLIMGCFKDKEHKSVLKIMLPIANSFTAITAPNEERALDKKELEKEAVLVAKDLSLNLCITSANGVKEAINDIKLSPNDAIIIFGSLSLSSLCEEIKNNEI